MVAAKDKGVSKERVLHAKTKWVVTYGNYRKDPLEEIMDANGRIDATKLEEWMMRNEIDPKDPENRALMDRVHEISKVFDKQSPISGSSGSGGIGRTDKFVPGGTGGHFRLDSYHDQFTFGTQDDLEHNPRFQMIQLRTKKVQEFKNYRMIPINAKEVPKGIFETLGSKK